MRRPLPKMPPTAAQRAALGAVRSGPPAEVPRSAPLEELHLELSNPTRAPLAFAAAWGTEFIGSGILSPKERSSIRHPVPVSRGLAAPLYILEQDPSGLLVEALTLGQRALMTTGPMRAAHFAPPRPVVGHGQVPDLPEVSAFKALAAAVAELIRAAQRAGRA